MNKIDGISEEETNMLRQILLFIRTAKPFESMEIKLNDNKPGEFSIMVKSNYKQVFKLD
jgi:hypothetical protein